MTINTDYHAKYFAHEPTKRHSVADAEKLVGALVNSVDYFEEISSFRSMALDVGIGAWLAQQHTRCTSCFSYLRVRIDMLVVGSAR